jgi:hypothetical protein
MLPYCKQILQVAVKVLLAMLRQDSNMKQFPFLNEAVQDKFNTYPKHIKNKLLFLRQLIFDTAKITPGVGKLEETLKWGEPSYVTTETKSGSTIRIDWKSSNETQYAIYFNCNTTLVDTFKTIYGDLFNYGGSRCIIFDVNAALPINELQHCIAIALTYHLNKKKLIS